MMLPILTLRANPDGTVHRHWVGRGRLWVSHGVQEKTTRRCSVHCASPQKRCHGEVKREAVMHPRQDVGRFASSLRNTVGLPDELGIWKFRQN